MNTIILSAPWADEYATPDESQYDLPEGYTADWDIDECLDSGGLRARDPISGEPSDPWGYGPLDETEAEYAARCAADRAGVYLHAEEDVDAEAEGVLLDLGTGRARQISALYSAPAAEEVAA